MGLITSSRQAASIHDADEGTQAAVNVGGEKAGEQLQGQMEGLASLAMHRLVRIQVLHKTSFTSFTSPDAHISTAT